jgi:glutathione S-transferase
MRLYYTPNSPYARIARVAARESGLIARIEEIEARTREAGTPHFQVTPLARVPVLVDGAVTLADTRDICGYFDELTGEARWLPEEDPQARYLRHVATGFLDGVAVWLRENARPPGQRSDPVMRYEEHRAERVLAFLETHFSAEDAAGFTALALACAVGIARDRGMGGDWRALAPRVLHWAERRAEAPAMRDTVFLPSLPSPPAG